MVNSYALFTIRWNLFVLFGQLITCAVPIQIVTMKVKGQATTLKPLVHTVIPNMGSLFGRRQNYNNKHRYNKRHDDFSDNKFYKDSISDLRLKSISSKLEEVNGDKALIEIMSHMRVGDEYRDLVEKQLQTLIERVENIPKIARQERDTSDSSGEIEKGNENYNKWKHNNEINDSNISVVVRKIMKMIRDSKYFKVIDVVDDEEMVKLGHGKLLSDYESEKEQSMSSRQKKRKRKEIPIYVKRHQKVSSDLNGPDIDIGDARKKSIILIEI